MANPKIKKKSKPINTVKKLKKEVLKILAKTDIMSLPDPARFHCAAFILRHTKIKKHL
jgi:hypothetical protein